MNQLIDLRSDTVTLPTQEMKQAMLSAELGDDVYGEDPTVTALEKKCARLLDKEAAIFAPSGTQSNLLALLSHCERGDEYIVGQDAHTFKYEGGGAAVLGSIQPQPLTASENGTIPLENIRAAIKPDDIHYARTKLVCLENTHHGMCLPQVYAETVKEICDENNLLLHLDGARLFNASVKQQTALDELTRPYDSVSLCLSKGLGAPVGSVLVGDSALITKARRWRKVLGGGMRQAGMLAAAGIYALDHHIDRLKEDHRRAKQLTEVLQNIGQIRVEKHSGITNMVFIQVPEESVTELNEKAVARKIKLPSGNKLRLVTHLGINDDATAQVIALFQGLYGAK